MVRKNKLPIIILYIFLTCIAILEILPLVLALANSLRTNADIKKVAIGFPSVPVFQNYVKAWTIGGYGQAFFNSIVISLSTSIIVLLLSLICGYFLARVSNRFTRFIQIYFGISLSIPIFSFIIPLYFNFAQFNMINTRFGVILIYIATNLAFNASLAATFIRGIPKSLDEAGIIDGCNTYQVMSKIVFPLSKPIITTIILIVFVGTWNEFTLANTFLQTPSIKTAATRYVLFCGERGSDLSLIYAAGIITMLPIVILFLCLQSYFIDGMTAGSIK